MSEATAHTTETDTSLIERIDARRVALYVVLVGMIGFYLAPIETGLMTSFKTVDAYQTTHPTMPPGPSGFTLHKWELAINALDSAVVNSLLLTVPATIISAMLGSMAAYGLTHVEWKGQVGLYMLFVAGIFIPYQAVLVPLGRFWGKIFPVGRYLGPLFDALPLLYDQQAGLIALIVTHVAFGIPICTLLFRSYYKDMSFEMIEAARLDGASVQRIYRRIVFPLSAPMFAVTLIYQFTQIWNDLLFALIITGPNPAVVTFKLVNAGAALEQIDFPLRMAAALVTAAPTILVYIIFGEQFAKGVAA